jgi:hypothetical protein
MQRVLALAAALPGAALIAVAARATPAFVDRHILLVEYFVPPPLWLFTALRVGALLVGVLLIVFAFKFTRAAIAIEFAFLAAAGVLFFRRTSRLARYKLESQLAREDAQLGWRLVPHKTTTVRGIAYAIDSDGDRAVAENFVEDPGAPTIVLAGESIAFGYGLAWPDTIAAQLAALTGAQVIDAGTGGYSHEQAWLRTMEVTARVHKVIAIVTIVLPVQLSRNLHSEFPYTSERGLQQSLQLAHSLFVRVPNALFVEPLNENPPPDFMISLLNDFPHLFVPLGKEQLLPDDGHPNAEGAKVIAAQIANYLFANPQTRMALPFSLRR